MSRTKWVLVVGLVLVVLAAVGLVAWRASHTTFSRLKGVWYQSSTGLKYDFASETKLVVPGTQPSGGNAISYQIVDGSKLALTEDGVTQVVEIQKLDSQELVTHDPSSGKDIAYFRDLNMTDFAQARAKIAEGALTALKRFPTIDPKPKIVWTVAPPSGDIPPWPLWATSSLARYKTAWNWSDVKLAPVSVESSGSGAGAGYAVVFERSVPTTEELAAYSSKTGQVVEPGGPLIDVGYSASKAQYPAGTFVYVKGGMLYSLGDGYAVGVRVGPTEAYGFIPYTYRQ